ncbi:calpain-2 catalytic subunit-like [Actinia tenebrosa]|uniref:Calpain-2 catalytic subunit-like n=1 Tax=Actinia tenebrosa TaxID=6105 RepID=A0A6P8IZQ7_ACTTE|nr:calpain-2 catalytic subunit-like [Actinia tenebrosa]
MGAYELRDALKGLNFKLSNRSLETIVLRFHSKRGVISFDMFVQINVRLVLMFESFLRRSRASRTGKVVFSMDDFIMATLCI